MEFTMSGWLDKRGGLEANKGWKRRWCILSNHTMQYYRSDSDGSPAGTIFAEDIVEVTSDHEESMKDSKHSFIFKVITKGRDYIFNAISSEKKEEWIVTIKSLIQANRSDPSVPAVHYATVDLFFSRGIRVTGEVGSVLLAQLATGKAKTLRDERGWFSDHPLPQATVLDIFARHGWSLATAFLSNSIPPNTNSTVPSDTMIFTHPYP